MPNDYPCTPDEALEVLKAKLNGEPVAHYLAIGETGTYYEVTKDGKRIALVVFNEDSNGYRFDFLDMDNHNKAMMRRKCMRAVLANLALNSIY